MSAARIREWLTRDAPAEDLPGLIVGLAHHGLCGVTAPAELFTVQQFLAD